MVLTRRRARTSSRIPAIHLAGWLFADLLLVLFLVSLSAQHAPEAPEPPPPPPQKLLSPDSCEFTVRLGSGFTVDRDRVVSELERILSDPDDSDFTTGDGWLIAQRQVPGAPGRAAGDLFRHRLGSGSREQIGAAKEFAADVTEIAIEEIPQFANAKYRELWTGGSPGSVELSLFFLE